jgi:hypothetical protein
MSLGAQIVWLVLLAVPISCVTWTVTHEEVFRELRDFCTDRSQRCRTLVQRKFFYLFTCEYCFSHYVTVLFLAPTGYRLLMDNWMGYVIAFFALVFVANAYMSLYARLRVDIRSESALAEAQQKQAELRERELAQLPSPALPSSPPSHSPSPAPTARADG